MSSLCGAAISGKRRRSASTISAVSSSDSVVWVTKARLAGSRGTNASASSHGLDQRHRARRQLAQRADHFRVAGVADQHDLAAGGEVALGLDVHLGDQRAGGVEIDHLPLHRLGRHRLRHAVGGEHHRPVVRAFLQLLDEHRAHRPQALDHVAVVDDLVAHIDRRAVLLDRPLDDLDGAVDAGAETAGAGEQDFEVRTHGART